jgi:hypothetical protein
LQLSILLAQCFVCLQKIKKKFTDISARLSKKLIFCEEKTVTYDETWVFHVIQKQNAKVSNGKV